MQQLSGGDPRFRADRGEADPQVVGALAAYAAGSGSEHAALTALASARLLVPVVAVRADHRAADGLTGADTAAEGKDPQHGLPSAFRATGQDAGEKATEMAVPVFVGRDGRPALPAFTSLEAVRRWDARARPVPVQAAAVWQAAMDQAQAVVIDIAGPVSLPVEGARLAALAAGGQVPPLHEDPDVRAVVAAVADAWPPGLRVRLGPSAGEADLTLELRRVVQPGTNVTGLAEGRAAGSGVPADQARSFAAEVARQLGGRASRGIALLLPPD